MKGALPGQNTFRYGSGSAFTEWFKRKSSDFGHKIVEKRLNVRKFVPKTLDKANERK